ncbi:MAG: DUF3299 domain-containing protein [Bryobacterales bacterium]|nr:DUF3299 domain-containing protein [Bryobacterales bacterium]
MTRFLHRPKLKVRALAIVAFALVAAVLPSSPLASQALAQQATAPAKLTWSALRKLNYRTGEMPAELKALDKKLVRVPGFVVPLEDSATEATEFLLVPYQGACIHVPPPPPNQIVHVKMGKAKKIKFTMWDPYWIEGTLRIETVDSPYGEVSFSLEGVKQEDYTD